MRRTSLVWICVLSVGLSCGTPSGDGSSRSGRQSRGATKTVDGLVKTEIDMPGVLFLREDHSIGTYDAFVIPPVAINYKRRSSRLKPDMEEELRTMVRDSLVASAEAAEVPVQQEPGQCVMQVALALYNVEIERRDTAASLGQMTLVLEFRDSMSGQPLLRYATQNRINNLSRGGSREQQLRRGFDKAIGRMDMGAALRVAGLADDRIRPGCNGLLAERGKQAVRAATR